MALILLRHTRPLNAEGLCYGRSDLRLAPCFQAQAARLERELPPFARVLSSPLSRCLRLARAMAAARGVGVQVDERLVEMDFGRWEGQRWDMIPRAQLDAWAADLEGANPHGGERVADLAARSRAALQDAARGASRDGGPALVVTHAGVIKSALAHTQGAAGWRAELSFGQWLRLDAALAPLADNPPT
ncbi:MAG: alpha-ribazole phosphatase family protein [Pararhodobacter sp.]|nr:alpha-ribazole phosphatase family protein [Pararhodobacter sp.]